MPFNLQKLKIKELKALIKENKLGIRVTKKTKAQLIREIKAHPKYPVLQQRQAVSEQESKPRRKVRKRQNESPEEFRQRKEEEDELILSRPDRRARAEQEAKDRKEAKQLQKEEEQKKKDEEEKKEKKKKERKELGEAIAKRIGEEASKSPEDREKEKKKRKKKRKKQKDRGVVEDVVETATKKPRKKRKKKSKEKVAKDIVEGKTSAEDVINVAKGDVVIVDKETDELLTQAGGDLIQKFINGELDWFGDAEKVRRGLVNVGVDLDKCGVAADLLSGVKGLDFKQVGKGLKGVLGFDICGIKLNERSKIAKLKVIGMDNVKNPFTKELIYDVVRDTGSTWTDTELALISGIRKIGLILLIKFLKTVAGAIIAGPAGAAAGAAT